MRGRRGLLLLLAALVLQPMAATATAAEVTEESADVRADVAAWFAEQAEEAVAGTDLGDPQALVVGAPRQVATWHEAYVAGDAPDAPADPLEEWIAPVVQQSAEQPEPVGVVRAGAPDGNELELLDVTAEAELAGALFTAAAGTVFIRDDLVDGWFATLDGEVWPVTEGARTVLQGALPAGVFQEFLAGWRGESAATPPSVVEEEPAGAVSPLIPIGVIVVLGAGVAWWLLRQYRRADSRIVADVHAGIAPPREDADGAEEDGRPDEDGRLEEGSVPDGAGGRPEEGAGDRAGG